MTYEQLSLTAVARMAKTTRRAITLRHASKAQLVIATFLNRTAGTVAPDTGNVRDDLVAFTRQNVKLFSSSEQRGLTLAALGAISDLGPTHEGISQPRRSSTVAILDRSNARGDQPIENFDLIPQLLAGAIIYRAIILNQETSDSDVQRLVDTCLNTATSKTGRPPHPEAPPQQNPAWKTNSNYRASAASARQRPS